MLREWWSCFCRWVSWRGCLFSVAGVKKNGSKVLDSHTISHSVQNRSSLEMSGENVAEKREEKAVDRTDAASWYPMVTFIRNVLARLSRTCIFWRALGFLREKQSYRSERRPPTPQHQPPQLLSHRTEETPLSLASTAIRRLSSASLEKRID